MTTPITTTADAIDIARLRANIERYGDEVLQAHEVLALCDEVDRLRSELEAVKVDAGRRLEWESMTPYYKRFITDAYYRKLRPSFQKWYRPICQRCSTIDSAMNDRKEG